MAAGNERANEAFLQDALAGTRFAQCRWVAETGSTNHDLALLAAQGAPEQLLVTDLQTAGRGRRNRTWEAPARSGVLMSVLVRDVDAADGFWAVGSVALAASQAIDQITTHACRLKWPNDVLLDTGQGFKKAAGVLAEIVDGGVIVGIGINVNWPDLVPPELEQKGTSVNRDPGTAPTVERAPLAVDIIQRAICHLDSPPEELRGAWKANCVTLGQRVRLERHDGAIVGIATNIDENGALQIDDNGVISTHHVGDVVHLRPAN